MRIIGPALALFACLPLLGCITVLDDGSRRAYAALQATDYVAAEQLYRDRLAEKPDDVWSIYNLAVVYQNTDRPQAARPLYERLIAMNPDVLIGTSTDGGGKGLRLVDAARANLARLPG